jgi:sec-independent protein translocase protein TatA
MLGLDNPIHIAFLLILLLLVFGAKRLPEMGKSLGSGMRGFKDSLSGEDTPAVHETPAPLAEAPRPIVSTDAVEHGHVAASVASAETERVAVPAAH